MAVRLSQIAGPLRESLFRNTGVSNRNIIGFLLGLTAAILLLSTRVLTPASAAIFFVAVLVFTMVLLVIVRPYREQAIDRFAWGLLVIVVLGFGLGTLVYQYREWLKWLWHQYRRINEPHELVLEFLFLLGVILGVFVVRIWAKEQKAFIDSLSGILGGTFVAAVLGESLKEQGLTPMRALTYYGLGFVMSAAINLLVAARLTANYTNRRSISSRALLDFLYGSERTKLIDGYFLQNFKEDPDYAKRGLTETLIECRKLVQREFAERLEQRRRSRKIQRPSEVKNAHAALDKLDADIRALPEPRSPEDETELKEMEKGRKDQRANLRDLLRQTKPSYFYELIAIECEDVEEEANEEAPVAEKDRKYRIIYKHIGSSSPFSHKVEAGMFRVGVSARWQDKLEYITAPGEYRVPFPYQNSVAGLALEFRQSIVMDRDIHKRFRNKQYTNGICPKDIEQDRGLDEIDFLSYVAIPIVSRPGSPDENAVGVLTIDTKLFVSHTMLNGEPEKGSKGIFSVKLTKANLHEYASNLYDVEDKDVKYIQDLTKIITPVLELYAKCRIGAI